VTAIVPDVGGPFVVSETTLEDVDPMPSVTVNFRRYTALARVNPKLMSMGDAAAASFAKRLMVSPSTSQTESQQ
jgi:hypothetical protein